MKSFDESCFDMKQWNRGADPAKCSTPRRIKNGVLKLISGEYLPKSPKIRFVSPRKGKGKRRVSLEQL